MMMSESFTREQLSVVEERAERLEAINVFLRERNLKELRELGDWKNPEVGTELMGIVSVYEEPKKFYTVVTFSAKFLGGFEGAYSLIFKANGDVADGSVFVTEIEGADGKRMFVLIDQYKISHGKRNKEIPRGFAIVGDAQGVGAEDLKSVKVFKELKEEAGVERVDEVRYLGPVMEDSTTSPSDAYVYYVKVSEVSDAGRALEDSEKSARLTFRSAEQMFRMIRDGEITDMHSLSAIQKAIANIPHLSEEYARFLLRSEEDFIEPENTLLSFQTRLGALLPGCRVDYFPRVVDMESEHLSISREGKLRGVLGWLERTFPDFLADVYFDRSQEDRRVVNLVRVYIRTHDENVIGEIKTALKMLRSKDVKAPKIEVVVT